MSVAESLDPRSSINSWIAFYLRQQRIARELSYAQAAMIMQCGRSTVSNIEAGRLKMTMDQAERLDKAWDLGQQFQLMVHFARSSHDPDWWQSYTGYEAVATVIKIYDALVVPGLLQIRDYARALFVAGRSDDPDRAADNRVGRQEVLHKADPPEVFVLLSQSILEWPVGGPEVLRAQLAHLLDVGQLPHVIIRIVPRGTGAHVGLDGSFRMVTVSDGDVAYAEAVNGGRLITDPSEVRGIAIRYDRISAQALPEGASRDLIRRSMERVNDIFDMA